MHRQPFRGIGLALGGVLLVAPVAAGAQGWGHLPSGELAYGLTYTTSAMLACAPSRLVVGSCLVSGNAITFTNGGASMTLTFESTPTGSRVIGVTQFSSVEAMEQTAMGMEEGLRAAMPQLDAALAEPSVSAAHA